jgi:hypothetical protein
VDYLRIGKMQELCPAILAATLLVATPLFGFGYLACAQGGLPFASPNDVNRRHLGPTGKPCLVLDGAGRPQLVNRQIFDHVVAAANSCPQRITVNVCYYGSRNCVTIDVPPYERKEAVLGVFPYQKDFRYGYTERF